MEEHEFVARGGNIKLGIYGMEAIPPVNLQIVYEGATLQEGTGLSDSLDLVGLKEVADLLGVSKQRASELAKGARFPVPDASLAAGPVWRKARVSRFVDGWQRKVGRPNRDSGSGD